LEKLKKKTALETLLFCVENVIHILLDAMYCDNFGRFYGRKLKKITNKAIKAERYHSSLFLKLQNIVTQQDLNKVHPIVQDK